ncbi:glycosyltransferase family 87 protein [uncultured Bradyrhizobium sp.]|uniref:glycosyltransferase family 87 protein n=1 Tax=uncultured Bradyrhizobium sp. TaxID=199684 RepID=UPI0035CB955D
MAHFWQRAPGRLPVQKLRSGEWLTAARARGYSLILLGVCAIAVIGWIAVSDGMIDRNGKPLGTDFSNPYAAGTLARAGKPADAYDPALQHAAERAVFGGRDVPFYGWHYPPFFFAVAMLVAAVPYAWGLLIWLTASLAAYLAVIRAIAPRAETMLVALAYPAVFVNIGHGQNGFLTAALLGGALHLLNRRPRLAGVLIGLLAYKPQFGVLIPLALLAGGRWSAIGAAAATVAALLVVSTFALGGGIWHAFADSTTFTQTVVLEQGGTGWEKIQSIFSAFRMWGAGVQTAYAVQIALALMIAASLAWLWQSEAAFELKASALATGSLLATPYVLDYDLVVLAVSIAFFARHGQSQGFRDYEISVLATAWIMPLLARGLTGLTGLPLGLTVLLALYGFTLCRAIRDRAPLTVGAGRIAQA